MFNLVLINLLLIIKNYFLVNIIIFIIYYKLLIISIKIKILIINMSLLVGFNNIHPFLFYISFTFIIYNILFFNKFLNYSIQRIYILIATSLLLGGLWGLGNSVWGFFWLKDPIEVLLFLLFLLSMFIVHTNFTYHNFCTIIIFFFFLIISLYSLRNGFVFTKHNFFNINLRKNIIVYIYYVILAAIFIDKVYVRSFLIINCIFNLFQFSFNFVVLYFSKNIINVYYKYNLKILHIFLFSLYFIWLKYRESNLSVYNFLTYYKILIFNYYLTLTQIYNLSELYIFKILLFFNNNSFYLYSFKLNLFAYINISYISFFLTILLLISNLKIVSK